MANAPLAASAHVGQPHTQTVGLPDIPNDVSPQLQTFLQGVKELLETREGQRGSNGMQRSVIVADMVAAGLYNPKTKSIGRRHGDTTPPQPPTNLAAFQRGTYNLITWTNPGDQDLDNTEIWVAKDSNDINAAKLRGVIHAPTEIFNHSVDDITASYTYWARAVDTSDNKSAWATSVATAGPGVDVAGEDIYEIFFGDLSKNPGVIRIRDAIQTVGAYYYEDQAYYTGDIVISGGYVYQAIQDNPVVDGVNHPPTDPAYWMRYDSIADVTVENNTRILQNENEITLRATKAEVQHDVDQINSVMTSTFAVQASEIAARVTKTDFYPTQQLAKDNAAELSVQATQIQSKVSQSSFNLLQGTVSTISSQVSQMAGSWTVKIQSLSNGQKAVTGIDLALDDGSGQSQFIVLADNFRVAANVNGSPVGLFAVSGNGVYINGTLYAPGSIQAGHLAANSVTADKVAARNITGDHIAFNTITGGNIQANSLWANDVIANGSITAAKIAARSITADRIAVGTIDAHCIKQNGIPLDKIVSGVVLQVAAGTSSVVLSQTGQHIYIVSAMARGAGQLTFTSGIGGQNFTLEPFWKPDGQYHYPPMYFATGKTGWSSWSNARWVPSSTVSLLEASIVGLVVK